MNQAGNSAFGVAVLLLVPLAPLSGESLAQAARAGRGKGGGAAATAPGGGEVNVKEGQVLACGPDVALRSERGSHIGDWRECSAGAPLQPLDRVRTGKGGLATLQVAGPEAPAAQLWPPAQLWLDQDSQCQLVPGTKKQPGGVALIEGAVRVSSERALRVLLPDVELRVRGVARVELSAGSAGARVSVYDGQAELIDSRGKRAAASLKVDAGSGVLVQGGRRGGAAARPRTGSLIGAPQWEGAHSLFFALPQRAPAPPLAEVALPFTPVQGAVRYRVEIGRDEALLDRVSTASLSAELRRAPLRFPGRGRYFVRLQAVDSDQMAGPGPVQAVEVAEVRGERVAVVGALGSGVGIPVLQGSGELTLDLLPGSGRLEAVVDERPVVVDPPRPSVRVRVGRGVHRVQVRSDAGHQGEMRVQVTRPSYEVEVSQGGYEAAGRSFHLEVRALDGAGQKAPPVVGLSARAGEAAVALRARAPGIYAGDLPVPAGQVRRLAIADADGPLMTADLRGSPE